MSVDSLEFIRFALDAGVLRFGQFRTKAGRDSPYFFNAGSFDDGAKLGRLAEFYACLLYTSDAVDERSSVDLGGRRIIKKKKLKTEIEENSISYHID